MNREKKEQHLKRVFSYVPSENDVAGEGIDAETNELLEETLGVSLTTRKKLPISFEELKFEEMTPRETLEKMFKDGESLLNVSDSVTTAASNEDRVRTVKNINSSYPLIVVPNKKNRNILECKCKSVSRM